MKNVIIVVIALALLVWAIFLLRTPGAVATAAARPWPGGAGTLDSVRNRVAPLQGNAEAAKLTALANALPKNDAIDEFVAREIARGELTIGEAPALPDVSTIRELLLSEPVIWERRRDGIGDQATSAARTTQMKVARVLVASALAKARGGDPAA
jgi:hypothetical protein